jgi:putative transposase
MSAALSLGLDVGRRRACRAFNISRASLYRQLRPRPQPPRPRATPARALTPEQRLAVIDALNTEEFADLSPAQVYAKLLDRGLYLASPRTMYRLLHQHGQVRERRNLRRHPSYTKPRLVASAPNQVWSWDITKLLGPHKWVYYHLYVVLDIYSRLVVGWLLAERERAGLAQRLIAESYAKQSLVPGQVTLHADRGAPMTAKSMAQKLAQLGIDESHSRPRTSNDNPFSEAQFKTLKYRSEFPERFDSFHHADSVCRELFDWYNNQHQHSSLAFLTPADVHYGRADALLAQRQRVLDAAYATTPERFVNGTPRVATLPNAVWINPPSTEVTIEVSTQ